MSGKGKTFLDTQRSRRTVSHGAVLPGQTEMNPDTSVRAGGKIIVHKLHSISSYKQKKPLLIRQVTQSVNSWEKKVKKVLMSFLEKQNLLSPQRKKPKTFNNSSVTEQKIAYLVAQIYTHKSW